MTHAETERSITRFAKEVLPRLKSIAPVTVGERDVMGRG
jgi:hypothetical protein